MDSRLPSDTKKMMGSDATRLADSADLEPKSEVGPPVGVAVTPLQLFRLSASKAA